MVENKRTVRFVGGANDLQIDPPNGPIFHPGDDVTLTDRQIASLQASGHSFRAVGHEPEPDPEPALPVVRVEGDVDPLSLDALDISKLARASLAGAGLTDVHSAQARTDDDLLALDDVGPATVRAIRDAPPAAMAVPAMTPKGDS